MTGTAGGGRRISGFEYWLRTGLRLPIEHKLNGWHDPDDGKSTFKGTGNYHGPGSGAGDRGTVARAPRPVPRHEGGTWQGGGFTGGGDGSFGGGGATGSGWETPAEKRARERQPAQNGVIVRPAQKVVKPALQLPARPLDEPKSQSQYSVRKGDNLSSISAGEGITVEQLASVNSISDPDKIKAGQELTIPAHSRSQPGWVSVRTERLVFEIDRTGLTRVARGILGEANSGRSKVLQVEAGKPDRQPTDDGGHLVAAKFGGPRAAYNHIAQDANFNRGAYRALEDQWAKAQREGKQVSVRIDISYPEGSKRPSGLRAAWTIAGVTKGKHFGNAKGGKRDGN